MAKDTSNSVPFSTEDILISRTDTRGVILASNETFHRISGYSAAELDNAPHKIVRHPDMSKGVFFTIWDHLQRDLPVAGYVKNRCKNGSHYWVFASISPLEGGHISMRMQPDPALLDVVEGLYEELRAQEARRDMSPAESARFIEDQLVSLGYAGYGAFAADHLALTQINRCQKLNRKVNEAIPLLRSVTDTWKKVIETCAQISKDYVTFARVSTNLQVQAGHLKGTGIALGAVANNFTLIASDINNDLARFAQSVQNVSAQIEFALMLVCLQDLMAESQSVLLEEGHRQEEEQILIHDQSKLYKAKSEQAFNDVMSSLSTFYIDLQKIKRSLSGLSMTRVMCAIESAQLQEAEGSSVSAIIQELQGFQDVTEVNMNAINGFLNTISTSLKSRSKTASNLATAGWKSGQNTGISARQA